MIAAGAKAQNEKSVSTDSGSGGACFEQFSCELPPSVSAAREPYVLL